ncbi:hypothetical protein Bbelb_438300 [Branchiostoma belcheri]|nr:hypothetical protein Bbelb_441110 [Branchiostoma belcheri]KAI8478436.1 hypothetical protein Bbelb_438300 [Branchiostoma belcheri]
MASWQWRGQDRLTRTDHSICLTTSWSCHGVRLGTFCLAPPPIHQNYCFWRDSLPHTAASSLSGTPPTMPAINPTPHQWEANNPAHHSPQTEGCGIISSRHVGPGAEELACVGSENSLAPRLSLFLFHNLGLLRIA